LPVSSAGICVSVMSGNCRWLWLRCWGEEVSGQAGWGLQAYRFALDPSPRRSVICCPIAGRPGSLITGVLPG